MQHLVALIKNKSHHPSINPLREEVDDLEKEEVMIYLESNLGFE